MSSDFPSRDASDHVDVQLRLGTSGWAYNDWVGNFYPAGTRPAHWLEHYVRRFNSVEVDSTFYGIPQKSRVERWAAIAPHGFEFALKVPQVITHEKSLRDCAVELERFLAVVDGLGDHLGPILFQFPYAFQPDRLSDLLFFLDHAPAGRFRYVVEIRRRDWLKSPLATELQARQIPLCWVDHPWMPRFTDVTGPFVYLRFLGDQKKITVFDRTQEDRGQDLDFWAAEVAAVLNRGVAVYGFFNNHFAGHAPSDASVFASLMRRYRMESSP